MMIAVAAGFGVGIICLLIKAQLVGTDAEGVWKVVDAIFFQDITATTKIEGIGLFYIIGQLFMRGLQMMIVPLVTVVNAVPSNIINALSSNNTIL